MSTSLATFSFPPPFNDQQAEPNLSLVAPPIPATGGPITEADFAFDFGSFSTDATFDTINWDLSGFESDPPSLTDSSSTPGSIDIVSPKSSFSSFGDASSPFNNTAAAVPAYQGIDIEALSKHHFERFLHYKTLADEAERKAKASLVQPGGFETLLAPIDMNVNTAVPAQQSFDSSMLMSYPTNLGQQYDQQPRAQSSFVYNPHVTEASMAQAQADAHLHAHNVAVAQVQQQRFYTQPQQPQQQQQHHGQAQAPSQYWVQPARTSFDAGSVASVSSASMSEPAWSRTSFSTNQSVSPPFSATPVAPISDVVQNAAKESLGLVNGMAPLPLPLASMPGPISSAPLANSVPAMAPSAALAEFVPASAPAPVKGGKKQVLNPHGGGRGYVPGKTPDDPKKRHKCVVCGRGFARAFNLKVSSLHHIVFVA